MALLLKRSAGGRRSRPKPSAEINVTPFVDVMLVLLVVFMITAPLLAQGIPVDLPKTRAEQLPSSEEQPLVVTVNVEGLVFVGTQEEAVDIETLPPMLAGIAQDNLERRVYVRGDQAAQYGRVVRVLALLQAAGFTNAGIVVEDEETGGG